MNVNGEMPTLCMVVIGIITIEIFALSQRIDGMALSASMVALGGIGGFLAKTIHGKIKK